MALTESFLEIREFRGIGYQPLVDYEAWRVAILRYIDELLPQNIGKMQRHDETDEVFVLLEGRCILFFGEGSQQITVIHAVDMQPMKLYNVKKGSWHTHTLDPDAMVLIIENRDTDNHNSPEIKLSDEQKQQIIELARDCWKDGARHVSL